MWHGTSRTEIDAARAHAAVAPRRTPQQVVAADIALAAYVLTLCAEFQHYCEARTLQATNRQVAKLFLVNLSQGRALQRGNPGYEFKITEESEMTSVAFHVDELEALRA